MLIQVPQNPINRRDPGIEEMIAALNRPKYLNVLENEGRDAALSLLSNTEFDAVKTEMILCQNKFEYASRNYFWIIDKDRQDSLLRLRESQELILEEMKKIKAKGRAQRLMILKARQLGALDPETNIAIAGHQQKELKAVRVGEVLASVEEFPSGLFGRRFTTSIILEKWEVEKEAFLVVASDGSSIIATEDHPFLSNASWVTVSSLQPGCAVHFVTNPWSGDQYLASGEAKAIASVKSLGVRKMIDIKTSTGTFIANGFVTHNCSTLIEALIAWTTMFFTNQTAIVVSRDSDHAAYLFGIMQHILDQMPWYLQPMIASRKIEEGLLFDNPDERLRRDKPGLHSMISVQSATQYSGIGQGYTINAAHASEGCDWPEEKARETMEGDLDKAIPDRANAFAIWESTAKGAGTYSHKLWLKNVELFEKGKLPKWTPVFLPWFFEKAQFIAPEQGWRPEKPEVALRERIKAEWVRCDNPECGQWRVATLTTGESIALDQCPTCTKGVLKPFVLEDGQLCWHWNERINSEKDLKSQKTSKQENPTTPEEAWQISGVQVFPLDCQEFVNGCTRPPRTKGFLDPANGMFHGPKKNLYNATGQLIGTACHQDYCKIDHRWDDNFLQIWEFPEKGAMYAIGVDVAEGLGGEADYSVAWVNKVSQYPGGADEQVAMLRSNTIGPVELAKPVNQLGRWYNDALMIIEWNRFDSLATWVANYYQYPNVYRWKHPDSIRPQSNKLHWNTQSNTKARLWQWAVRGLRSQEWIVRAKEFYDEMLTFQKESYEDRSGSAEFGFHDDVTMAGLIAYYGAHDSDWDPNLGEIHRPSPASDGPASAAWTMTCKRCGAQYGVQNPEEIHLCSECGCRILSGKQNEVRQGLIAPDYDKTMLDMEQGESTLAEDSFYSYNEG